MLGAFRSFIGELEQKWPLLYREGEFDTLMTRLERLSVATTEEGVGLSDQCVSIVQSSDPTYAKLFSIQKAIDDFGREMMGSQFMTTVLWSYLAEVWKRMENDPEVCKQIVPHSGSCLKPLGHLSNRVNALRRRNEPKWFATILPPLSKHLVNGSSGAGGAFAAPLPVGRGRSMPR
jgi:hypothetical protein